MHNIYFALRHGQSKANVAGIILSHRRDGQDNEYTLTPEGERQVRQSVRVSKDRGELGSETLIVSSPFSRCRRSAEIAKDVLGVTSEIITDDRLRERWFGDFERMPTSNYENVWHDDGINPDHTTARVESARDVQERTLSLVRDLEHRYTEQTILLVSHGDALQILQTGLAAQSPALHRAMPHFEVAEVRKLES